MKATTREYYSAGYQGRVYVSGTDPAQDPDIVLKDGDIWQVPGSTIPYVYYSEKWYAAELYGPEENLPQAGVPCQKYFVINEDGSFGDVYIVPPGSTQFVCYPQLPEHHIDPHYGPHTGKLHLNHILYWERATMLAAIWASRAVERT